jgi:hypothetical protein
MLRTLLKLLAKYWDYPILRGEKAFARERHSPEWRQGHRQSGDWGSRISIDALRFLRALPFGHLSLCPSRFA